MLVTYTIYQEQYFGKSIPEEEFNAYSRLSESYVNQYTFTRIQNTLSDQEKENVTIKDSVVNEIIAHER